jgi:hypothetical protein
MSAKDEITQRDIEIEEMPQGCFLSLKRERRRSILVSSPADAIAIIESLCKMIAIQHPEHLPKLETVFRKKEE